MCQRQNSSSKAPLRATLRSDVGAAAAASDTRSERIIVSPDGEWRLTLMRVEYELGARGGGEGWRAYRQLQEESARSRRMILMGYDPNTRWQRYRDYFEGDMERADRLVFVLPPSPPSHDERLTGGTF